MAKLEIRIPLTPEEAAELTTICEALEVPLASVFADVAADAINVYRARYKSRLELLAQRKAALELVKPTVIDTETGEVYVPLKKEVPK